MSQRLHVGETDKDWYDCIVTSLDGVHDKMLKEWLKYDSEDRCYFGPWKIIVKDKKLFSDIEPEIDKMFSKIGEKYPECLWGIYYL